MLDELKNKAAELANDARVKEAIEKGKEFLNSEKGKETLDSVKDQVEGFMHKFGKK